MSLTTEYLLMLGFFIAFAVKLPVVPCTPGCRMPTPRRRPPVPWTWPVSC
jgi:NADH-quinone oxidoreductase subunit M